ncbi:MAG: mandelate racemase/muconate lactonizing enzyme family protein [candidate division WS1 bacterium]|jgi:D-galactarolactone cycloisomerase|nr:mandelate racemase/muconate lactonizing enzyme family protein [candidate division WS1 bacterium]
MLMTSCEAIHLRVPLETPIPASVARPITTELSIHLVRVTREDGAVAWGEGWHGDAAEFAQAVEQLAPVIADADPLDRGALWERMVDRLTGLKEPLAAGAPALSAIDIALWDLAGRALDLPVYQLLGGRRMARLDAYATGIYLEEPRIAAQKAQAMVEAGFRGVKIKAGAGVAQDIAVAEAVREVLGPQAPLLVDANQAFEDRDEAMELGAALDRLEVFWYEEPLPPGDWKDYVVLRNALNTPIAGGERLRSPGAFLQAMLVGALDVVMPDVRLCGGITGMMKIAELARWFNVSVSPHNWASQIGALASGHAAVTLPNCYMTEIEATRTPASDMLVRPLQFEDGFVVIPDAPGLGIEVREEFVSDYARP